MTVEKNKNLTLLIRICLILCAVEWAVFAVLNFAQSPELNGENLLGNWMALLMMGNAVLFGLGAWLVEKPIVQVFLLLWLFINFVLTFTDDFGVMDLLNAVLIGFILCLLMVKTRSNKKNLKKD